MNETPSPYATPEADLTVEVPNDDRMWSPRGRLGGPRCAAYQMVAFNAFHACVSVDLTSRSRNLVVLPTFHTGGLNVWANPAFHSGGANVVMRTFDPAHFLALMTDKDLCITHALGVPTNFLMLAQELPDRGRHPFVGGREIEPLHLGAERGGERRDLPLRHAGRIAQERGPRRARRRRP